MILSVCLIYWAYTYTNLLSIIILNKIKQRNKIMPHNSLKFSIPKPWPINHSKTFITYEYDKKTQRISFHKYCVDFSDNSTYK